MRYLLIDNKVNFRKVIPIHEGNMMSAYSNLKRTCNNVEEVGKPPAARTVRRWKQRKLCRAICGCFIPCISGSRCEVHNKMSWLTALNMKV